MKSAPHKTNDKWPDQYLYVTQCSSGDKWMVPLRANAKLDLKRQVKRWIKDWFGGECVLNGNLMPRLEGDYYAVIITDGRPPTSVVVWQSGGFFVKPANP